MILLEIYNDGGAWKMGKVFETDLVEGVVYVQDDDPDSEDCGPEEFRRNGNDEAFKNAEGNVILVPMKSCQICSLKPTLTEQYDGDDEDIRQIVEL